MREKQVRRERQKERCAGEKEQRNQTATDSFREWADTCPTGSVCLCV